MNKCPEAYKTIGEVSLELNVPQYVLRYWEARFKQIKPMKRAGGRRYYGPLDMEIVRIIHGLLYVDRYTIRGAQRIMENLGPAMLRLAHRNMPCDEGCGDDPQTLLPEQIELAVRDAKVGAPAPDVEL